MMYPNYAEAVAGEKHETAGFDTRMEAGVFFATLSAFVKQRKSVTEKECYICKKGGDVLKHMFEDGSEVINGVSIAGLNVGATGRVLTTLTARISRPSHWMQSSYEYDDEYFLNRVSARVPGTQPVYVNFDKRTYLSGDVQYGVCATEKAPPGSTEEWAKGSMKRVEDAVDAVINSAKRGTMKRRL
jgi:hypothetical protein